MVKRSVHTIWCFNVRTDVAMTLTPELDKRAKVLVLEVKVDTVF